MRRIELRLPKIGPAELGPFEWIAHGKRHGVGQLLAHLGREVEIARGQTVVPGGTNVILLAKEVDLENVIRLLTQTRQGATERR